MADLCAECGTAVRDGYEVDVTLLEEPWRETQARFCTWDHATAWFSAGESDKQFDLCFADDGEPSVMGRASRTVGSVGALGIAVALLVLCAIGGWTVLGWISPGA